MAERVSWRPRWYIWAVLGLALLWLIHGQAPWLLQGRWLLVVTIALPALLFSAAALWELQPATMLCAALAMTIFSGNWGRLGLPGFPLLPDRILLVGALLSLMLGAPGASGLPRMRVRGVHLLLAVTVLYATASAAAVGTLGSRAGVFDLLDRLGAIPFLMLLVAPVVFAGPRERNMLLATLVGLGGYLGLTACLEAIGPHALVVPRYIWDVDAAAATGQARGPFSQAVTEGFACYACGVAAVIACSAWRRHWPRRIAAAVAVISLFACMLSLERGIWIGAVAGAVAVGFAARDKRGWVAAATAAGAVAVALVLMFAPNLANHATARASTQRSVWDRQNQTSTALRMIAAKPLFGFGWDRYTHDNLDYFRQADSYPLTGVLNNEVPLPLHNTYLSNAVELGLVGGMLWLTSLLCGLGGAIAARSSPELRPWRLGLLALTVLFFVLALFDPLQQNFTELVLWIWAGIAWGAEPARRASARAGDGAVAAANAAWAPATPAATRAQYAQPAAGGWPHASVPGQT